MEYEKLISESEGETGQDNLISLTVAQHIVKVIVGGSLPGEVRDTRDPDAALDGVLMGLALVLEQAPECATPRALRQQAEEFGKRLAYHAKIMRGAHENSGVHPIAHIMEGFGSPTSGATVN